MNYYVTSTTEKNMDKIINRIKEVGIKCYNYHNCYPTKIITLLRNVDDFKKGQRIIYFENKNDHDIEYMKLLGFGFDGLFEDEEKIYEIESFGKYRCIIYNEDEITLPDKDIEVKEFIL